MTDEAATIDVVVRDGSTVTLRRTREHDVEPLLRFLNSLSAQTLYNRFLGLPALSPARVGLLAAANGQAGTSLIVESA